MTDGDELLRAQAMVAMAVGDRLELAEEPPGFRLAITGGVLARLGSITARMRDQFEHLRTPSSRRIPDAYYADEQETENELQKVGAGLRAAIALGGSVGDPFEIERDLAADLTPTGIWARRGEASRVPRPTTRPAVFDWSLEPIPWIDDEAFNWPPADADALTGTRQLAGDEAERVRVGEVPFTDWVQLGFIERQRTFATRYPTNPGRQVLLIAGLEVCDGPPPANSGPLSELPPGLWAYAYTDLVSGLDQDGARAAVATIRKPLAALVSFEQTSGAPSQERGLGLHQFCLTPQLEIVALLGLRPETPAIRHTLVDDQGQAMVCRQWRSYLVHDGNYGPLEPAVVGADLIIRRDLFDILEAAIGANRIDLGLTVRHHQGPQSHNDTEDQ
jgi:hypothetical protein